MSFFQHSVINKYQKALDKQKVAEAYSKFKAHFHNPEIQENIRNSKEEQYQGEFLIDLFVTVLGYIKNPTPGFNITTEYKNVKDSKKADGAILLTQEHAPLLVIAVIELKGTETTDLNKIENQAFGYKNNQPECVYVITSNFEKLRFYIDNAIEYIEFNLFTLGEKDFELLWLCLSYESIAKGLPKRIKDESISHEDVITKNLYNDYSLFKRELHQNLVTHNPLNDALTLFKKSQKLLDRFLFLFFAEDRQLLPPNSVRLILDDWRDLQDRDVEIQLYARFKKYFEYLNTGFKGKRYDVFAYNGGLFKTDELLNALKIDDELLYRHTLKLSEYDFDSEVDVNILGHIFENSLNELDEIQAQLEGQEIDKTKTKRKKDGVFYTPKYITKYIVDNTVGKLCTDKKAELQLNEEEYITDRKRTKKTIQPLFDKLTTYRNWLLKLTICDPACGSGAFLNQALDYLITEHRVIDELQAKLFGDAMVLTDTEKSILENNLFGVDINEESVEIAKLSLWLRTAQPNRKLNDLNNNIKCGNSLIDDPKVAGDKAFNWQKEFPQVFAEKAKKAWHITTATHNSRYSQRMFDNYVKLGEPVWLSAEEEEIVTSTIADIAKKDNLNIPAYNICGDHMHLVLVCEDEELAPIVQKIKSMSARACNIAMGRTIPYAQEHAPVHIHERGTTQNHLWTQKFGQKEIMSEEQLNNTIKYIQNNRVKHGLPENLGTARLAADFCCTVEHAFRTEYKGGFDVVIGNPPYGASFNDQEKAFISKFETYKYRFESYVYFFEIALKLANRKGYIGFLTPVMWLNLENCFPLRKFISDNSDLIGLNIIGENVFVDAVVNTMISIICRDKKSQEFEISYNGTKWKYSNSLWNQSRLLTIDYKISPLEFEVIAKIESDSLALINFGEIIQGITPYDKYRGQDIDLIKDRGFHFTFKKDETCGKWLSGEDINRYSLKWSGEWLSYGEWLAAPREKKFFEGSRIIFREIPGSNKRIQSLLTEETSYYGHSITPFILNDRNDNNLLKKILCVVNSKLMSWYGNRKLPNFSKEIFPKLNPQDIKSLPINSGITLILQPFIEKADQMLSLNKELQEVSGKFQRSIQRKFFPSAMTVQHAPLALQNKLQNWYLLSYSEFIAELAKKKVKLSLSEEAEWEAYFLQECTIAQQIKARIDKTDKEIDAMVYELYGLTEEEIRIVEGV